MPLDNHGAGFILFCNNVSRDEIAKFIRKLKASGLSSGWIYLHMREAGDETMVTYRVDFSNISLHLQERFHHQMIERLIRHFGENADKTPKGVKILILSSIFASAT